MIPNISTAIHSLITQNKKNDFIFFDLLKLVRIMNFQKKLVKKVTQLVFGKIGDN